VHKQSAFAANGADELKKFTPVNQGIEQKFIADFARRKDSFRERTPLCRGRRLQDGDKGSTPRSKATRLFRER
jgi:hypothetical protein